MEWWSAQAANVTQNKALSLVQARLEIDLLTTVLDPPS
jgi:hypothetical protein